MVVLTQRTLNAGAVYYLANHFKFLTVGTGDDAIQLDSTDIETPVQIGASNRNKIRENAQNRINGNFFTVEAILAKIEPDTQPVNLGEAGFQTSATKTDELEAAFVHFPSTKDNASQWIYRFSGKVIEGA